MLRSRRTVGEYPSGARVPNKNAHISKLRNADRERSAAVSFVKLSRTPRDGKLREGDLVNEIVLQEGKVFRSKRICILSESDTAPGAISRWQPRLRFLASP